MSRSGYSDDCDGWSLICWRGAVTSAIRGVRGQKLLRDLLAALDAMPEKKLIAKSLERDGCYCALGVVGAARGIDLNAIDPDNSHQVAMEFDIAEALAKEIVYINDEADWYDDTPEKRWKRVRQWVFEQVQQSPQESQR